MPFLVKEDHLLSFLTDSGLRREHIATLGHENLLGLTMAVLDYEARAHHTPGAKDTYGQTGYATGIKTLAARTASDSDRDFATLSVLLAEHTIGRLLGQLADLEPEDDLPPFMKPVACSLFAAGALLALANKELDRAQYRPTVRTAQDRISEARRGLDDVKKALKAQGIPA